MLEHILVSQIMDHLDRQNILHDNQHGFHAKRSCETQPLMTTDDIAKYLNQGKQVDMGILDFSKAFDKVPHTTTLIWYTGKDTSMDRQFPTR